MNDALAPGADLAKVYGESTRCPVCGAFAKTLPHPDHHWVCAICGSPRVVMPEGEPLPEESALAMKEASGAMREAALQKLLTWVLGIPAGMALLLAIALASASFLAAGVIIATGVVLAILASRASRRASTERKRLRSAVERAYEAAIAQLATKDKTPQEIAAALHIPEAEVEATLAVDGVRVAVPTRVAQPEAQSSELEAEAQAESELEQKK